MRGWIVGILGKRRTPAERLVVDVEGRRREESPRRFGTSLTFRVDGAHRARAYRTYGTTGVRSIAPSRQRSRRTRHRDDRGSQWRKRFTVRTEFYRGDEVAPLGCAYATRLSIGRLRLPPHRRPSSRTSALSLSQQVAHAEPQAHGSARSRDNASRKQDWRLVHAAWEHVAIWARSRCAPPVVICVEIVPEVAQHFHVEKVKILEDARRWRAHRSPAAVAGTKPMSSATEQLFPAVGDHGRARPYPVPISTPITCAAVSYVMSSHVHGITAERNSSASSSRLRPRRTRSILHRVHHSLSRCRGIDRPSDRVLLAVFEIDRGALPFARPEKHVATDHGTTTGAFGAGIGIGRYARR